MALILKPSRVKSVRMLIFSIAIVAESIYFVVEGTSTGRFGAIVGCAAILFFGPGLILYSVLLIPGSAYLKLDSEGFMVRTIFRAYSVRWEEVESFQVRDFGSRKMVVFNFSNLGRGKESVSKLAIAPGLHEGILRDTYRRSPEKLAATMNEWRARALQSTAS